MNFVTVRIDISSQAARTAACAITWKPDQAIVADPRLSCGDDELAGLVANSHAVGIDAPFGWPADFTAAVTIWSSNAWNDDVRKRMCFRLTDRHVREKVGRWPLSVSADRIALPAMRTFALLLRHGVIDRSGDGKFFEVYPAGSLFLWNLPNRSYKDKTAEHRRIRETIIGGLRRAMPWLTVSDTYAVNADALDALIASLTPAPQCGTIASCSLPVANARFTCGTASQLHK